MLVLQKFPEEAFTTVNAVFHAAGNRGAEGVPPARDARGPLAPSTAVPSQPGLLS